MRTVTEPKVMNPIRPISVANIFDGWDERQVATPDGSTIAWSVVVDRLDQARTYWMTATDEDGPHTRPVLAVVVDDRPCFSSAATSRKSRMLRRRPSVSLAASTDGMDVVVRGTARRLTSPDALARVAAAFEAKYGWPARPEGDALTAPYGAPTAGSPPYHVVALEPATVHAFGTDDHHGPRSTRWTLTN